MYIFMIEKINFKTDLNERERKVLTSIIHFPMLSDIDIAIQVGIKHSTFATIKKRLQNKEYFTRIYLPNFLGFGVEIISMQYCMLSELTTKDSLISSPKKIIKLFESLKEFPNLLFTVIENNIISTMSCYQNFAQLEEESWKFDNFNLKYGLDLNSQHELHFPIRYSEFPRFFDYSRTISKHFHIDLDTDQMNPVFLAVEEKKINITPLGYKILYSFLEAPGRTPKDVSRIIGKPRTTTTRWLRKFINAGLITPKIIPDVQKLGYKILYICHYSIVSTQTSKFHNALEIIDKELSPIILIKSEFDIVLTAIFQSFEVYQEMEANFTSVMNKAEIRFTVEFHYLLSLPHTTSTLDFMGNFAPIVSRFSER